MQGLGTRAVLRIVQPGTFEKCVGCNDWIKFRGRRKVTKLVICNVYEEERWHRVELYHEECYTGQHGTVTERT